MIFYLYIYTFLSINISIINVVDKACALPQVKLQFFQLNNPFHSVKYTSLVSWLIKTLSLMTPNILIDTSLNMKYEYKNFCSTFCDVSHEEAN